MPVSTKATIGANYLQTKLDTRVLETLEPNLYYAQFGKRPMSMDGYGTAAWTKPTKMTVSAATATLTEGTTPASQAYTYTTVTATPTQYGIFVELSDRVIKAAKTAIIDEAGETLGYNIARIIDQVVQTTVNAGTLVIYADAVANRAALGAPNTLGGAELNKAAIKLKSTDAKEVDGGGFIGIVHPFAAGDLRAEANGAWVEFSKYTTPDKLFNGETGKLYGVRLVESSNVQTFTSTVTVYPTLVMGKNAYGVTDWTSLSNFYKPLGSGSSDPLNQRATIGTKVDFATVILEQNAMVRIESSATAV